MYQISDVVKNVHIYLFGESRSSGRPEPGKLVMDGASTYCDYPVCAWDLRPYENHPEHNINFGSGCWFYGGDVRANASRLPTRPMTQHDIGREEMDSLRKSADDLRHFMDQSPPTTAKNQDEPPSEAKAKDEPAWFLKWTALVAAIFGAGGGAAAASSVFWCGSAGIFVKGPLGFSIAAGCFGCGGAATAAVAGCAVGGAASAYIAASTIVYLVPWKAVFRVHPVEALRHLGLHLRDDRLD